MTAVITKQNAKYKAFINSGGGSGGDYPLDATFDTIKVNKEATFTVNNKDLTFSNHETRIAKLEKSGGGGSGDSSLHTHTVPSYLVALARPQILVHTIT